MRISVFCSANADIDPVFFQRAEELGRWMAQQGHVLVFGGADMGLMECVARTVSESGGTTIGVVPDRLEDRGRVSHYINKVIRCGSLNERIQLMIQESDAFIALPGGIGTLDELFSVAASRTIGYHTKPLILYNMNGYWDHLISMLDAMQGNGTIRKHWREYILIAGDLTVLSDLLST